MIKYRSIKKYKYQLLEPCAVKAGIFPKDGVITDFITLSVNGWLIICKGYAWDGPSGPTWDSQNFMRGSLIHDALYQLIRDGFLNYKCKRQADNMLKQICLEDGMSKFRVWYVHKAVQAFGRFAIKPLWGWR